MKAVVICLVCVVACFGLIACSHNQDKKEQSFCITANISQSGINLKLQNLDTFDWHDVKISINATEKSDGFDYSMAKVAAGGTVDLPLREFIRDDGMRFKPDDYVYVDGTVDAKEGMYMKEMPCESSKSH